MTITTSIRRGNRESSDNEEVLVQVFVQQMLVTRIFAATYTCRNYVHSLKDYRDVLKVNKEENDLIRDLSIVKKRIDEFYDGAMWAAITEPADTESEKLAGTCVWTRLENVAFGSYWFMIQQVRFSASGELLLDLKVVRKYEPETIASPNIFDSSMKWDEVQRDLIIYLKAFGIFLGSSFKELMTWYNIKESGRFICLLMLTLGTGLIHGLHFLSDYSIKFFKEFNNFIRVMTPIFLAIIDMLSKTIGGFYLLLVMLFRSHNQTPVPQFPALMSAPRQNFQHGYQKRPLRQGYQNRNYY